MKRIANHLLVIVALGSLTALLAGCGGSTVMKGSHQFEQAGEAYVVEKVEPTSEKPTLSFSISVAGQRSARAYVFTDEQFGAWEKVRSGKDTTTKADDLKAIWKSEEAEKIEEAGVELPGPGKYQIVIDNAKFNQASITYKVTLKD